MTEDYSVHMVARSEHELRVKSLPEAPEQIYPVTSEQPPVITATGEFAWSRRTFTAIVEAAYAAHSRLTANDSGPLLLDECGIAFKEEID